VRTTLVDVRPVRPRTRVRFPPPPLLAQPSPSRPVSSGSRRQSDPQMPVWGRGLGRPRLRLAASRGEASFGDPEASTAHCPGTRSPDEDDEYAEASHSPSSCCTVLDQIRLPPRGGTTPSRIASPGGGYPRSPGLACVRVRAKRKWELLGTSRRPCPSTMIIERGVGGVRSSRSRPRVCSLAAREEEVGVRHEADGCDRRVSPLHRAGCLQAQLER
jgi:hypothetical protein